MRRRGNKLAMYKIGYYYKPTLAKMIVEMTFSISSYYSILGNKNLLDGNRVHVRIIKATQSADTVIMAHWAYYICFWGHN